MGKSLFVLLSFLLAGAANALVSRDLCPALDPCSQHLLEWRETASDVWTVVGPPLPLSPVSHPQVTGLFLGVVWTGFANFGQFQARATRNRDVSLGSNILDLGPETFDPVPPPQMLSKRLRNVTEVCDRRIPSIVFVRVVG